MTLTPEQAKRLNEIGALCMGWKLLGENHWRDPEGRTNLSSFFKPMPDLSLSSPPTDAQKLAVWALRDRAIEKDRVEFARRLRGIAGCHAETATLKQILIAALRITVPDEHTEELERLLEGE